MIHGQGLQTRCLIWKFIDNFYGVVGRTAYKNKWFDYTLWQLGNMVIEMQTINPLLCNLSYRNNYTKIPWNQDEASTCESSCQASLKNIPNLGCSKSNDLCKSSTVNSELSTYTFWTIWAYPVTP